MLDFSSIKLDELIEDSTDTIEKVSTRDIAIIGINVQLPMADNINEFWNNIANQVDCVINLPKQRRKDMDSYIKCMGIPLKTSGYSLGGYLSDIDKFDYSYFKISPKEASLMDPNQRKFLQAAWNAVEDAGYGGSRIKGSRTGVYLGYNSDTIYDYKRYILAVEPESASIATPGNLNSIIASRISYLLDLRGPSVSIDTACSSSLVAIHFACQGLRNGDCEMAIAGSVKINMLPVEREEKLGIESSDGRARTFDDSSDGTGMGEGVAAILLKPLHKAVEAGDNIYAVIKGSAVNQDGSSIGITAPNAVAQEDVIIKAWEDAGIDPETISYIEAHGTGTELGDPIEIDGITRAFRRYSNKKQFCAIGSVKTNIGHLDNASGIVGLIKTTLALKNKKLPPNIHFNNPNKKISFIDSPVYVSSSLDYWKTEEYPRRAGVSAFGISGTNCHVILEEYIREELIEDQDNCKNNILVLSAKSEKLLKKLALSYKKFLQQENEDCIEDICYTAATGREHYNCRLAVIGSTKAELADKLEAFNLGRDIYEQSRSIYYSSNADRNKVNENPEDIQNKLSQYINNDISTLDTINEICMLYTDGADLNWEILYNYEKRKKVSLPVYPFEGLRCWLDAPENIDFAEMHNIESLKHKAGLKDVALKGRTYNTYSDTEKQIAQIWGNVLGFTEISVDSNFYELGGDSIYAMKIANNINNKLNIKIEASDILKHQTIEEIAVCLDDKYLDKQIPVKAYGGLEPVEKMDYYSVSSAQKRLYITNQISGIGTSYNNNAVLEIQGEIDITALRNAFNTIIKRHESLRTSFEIIDNELVQIIHEAVEFDIEIIDAAKRDTRTIIQEFIKPFDLGKAPLIRVGLVKNINSSEGMKNVSILPKQQHCSREMQNPKILLNNQHLLIVDVHHIVSDGTSIGILVKELITLYQNGSLEELKLQYKDFASWHNKLLTSDNYRRQKEYWLKLYSDELPVLNLPTDYTRPSILSYEGESYNYKLNEVISNRLKRFAKEKCTTLNILLLAAYNILLSKYSGQEDIIIGSVISGRRHRDVEDIIGMFVNTLALRNYPKAETSFEEFLAQVMENTLAAYENQDCQFEDIINKLNLQRDLSRNPLFDTLFIMQNIKMPEISVNGLKIKDYEFKNKSAKFDLTLQAYEEGSNINLVFEYSTSLFKQETIERLAKHYEKILEELLRNPQAKLCEMDMLANDEKNQILEAFNNTKVHYECGKTLHQIFEEQAEKTPNSTVVVFKDKNITYRELNEKANQLARVLRSKGVCPDTIVGIMTTRSFEMLIGIMAILKAGGAYLPIDPEYPKDRIEYMLKDSNAQLLITQAKMADSISFEKEIVLLHLENLISENTENLPDIASSKNLAYVIYTSGSTGKPKGVMIEHKAVHNFIKGMTGRISFSNDKTILALTTICFDIFGLETLLPLAQGMKIVIADEDTQRDPKAIIRLIQNQRINILQVTPSRMEMLLTQANIGDIDNLTEILIGGEAFSQHLLDKLKPITKARIYNVYGPTETTIWSTLKELSNEDEVSLISIGSPITIGSPISIGAPIANTRIYILDKNKQLQPIGTAGELYISGDGLARGYLNKPELTAERFLDNPYDSSSKMYRTGDLARWLPDGNIEFLGRIDFQVKIRGFRIELGEIENSLLSCNGIKEAVVTGRQDKNGSSYLCAYVTADEPISDKELKEHLAEELPEYMIPQFIIQLNELPINENGKINRKLLPEPDINTVSNSKYETPGNRIEEALVKLWKQVLGVEHIGINDNFFELGGHSLKAAALTANIRDEFEMEVTLTDIFKAPNIKAMAQYISKLKQSDFSIIKSTSKESCYPLSSAQKRIYILQQLEPEGISYNISAAVSLEGVLDTEALKESFRKLIRRHESLRTFFILNNNEPIQIIHDHVDFDISCIDANEEMTDVLIQDFIKSFDLQSAPLLRAGLLRLSDVKHILIMDLHHIIADGISISILINELSMLYSGMELPELKIQYKDYSKWQSTSEQREKIKQQEKYWMRVFAGEIPVLNLPADYPRPSIQSFEGDSISFDIGSSMTANLIKTARETETTIYMLILAAFNVVLSRYSQQEDIVIGTPSAGRPRSELYNIIGMFVNTLAMRNHPEGKKSFREFLNEVKANSLLAYENQDYQFEELIENLNITRRIGRNPLFDVMFNMQNIEMKPMDINGLSFKPYNYASKISKLDISLTAVELKDNIRFNLEYCTKLFKRETIERMAAHLVNTLNKLSENPDIKLSDIDILSEEERKLLLLDFNNTKTEYPKNKTIHQLFEEQAAKTPNNTAIVFKDKNITYKELNEKANQLARVLRSKGVCPDTIVGIMTTRSFEMLIGIMAILKAGGAYLPIDPEYPKDRIEYMLKDSNAEILVTQAALADSISLDKEVVLADTEAILIEDTENLVNASGPRNLAYVIYTSGSTGKPKGVMIEHKSVLNFIKGTTDRMVFSPDKTILALTTICFDIFGTETLLPLTQGMKIVLADENTQRDPREIINLIQKEKVNILQATPSRMEMILTEAKAGDMDNLTDIIVGGEVFSQHLFDKLKPIAKGNIYNIYGPTETTIWSTTSDLSLVPSSDMSAISSPISIGAPIANTRIYILDKNKQLQPIGIAGELYISGDGLARGYLNKPELTAERFLDNPYDSSSKMYRTGDLARWLPDGNIEFLGRIDFQVKIRGFRIELGEIENSLLSCDGIKEAVVTGRQDKNGSSYLCAYVTADEPISDKELKEHLAEELPEYMIPQFIIQLNELPINENGKINRKLLPEPDINTVSNSKYETPGNRIEEALVKLWKQVLGVEHIGINDNFFELGGHSLKAAILTANIREEFEMEVTLTDIFKAPNIKAMAQYISKLKQSDFSIIKSISKESCYPLSSAQKRIYILQQLEPDGISYNISSAVSLEGVLDTEALKESFRKLIRRHESLRTSFILNDNEPNQIINDHVDFDISCIDANEEMTDVLIQDFIKSFDLQSAPLLRAGLLRLSDVKHILIMDMHHIISDGISISILINELSMLYSGMELPELKIQYKDYSKWQSASEQREKIKQQEKYWMRVFAGEIPVLNLPADYTRPSIQSFEGDSISFDINSSMTERLKKTAKETGATIYMLILSVFNVVLSRYSLQEDIIIGTPAAGRPRAELYNIIGMFVNTLAMRNYPEGSKSFRAFIDEVKENSLLAFENQDYQFEELIETLKITRKPERNPLFDVMFNMQNMEMKAIEVKNISFKPYNYTSKISKFDISLTAVETEGNIHFNLEYCTKLFKKDTMERMAGHIINTLDKLLDDPDIRLSAIDILSQEERMLLLTDFNNTRAEYPQNRTIHSLFEEQAERTPDNIAVVMENSRLTYRELNSRSESLAGVLRASGVGRDSIVALMTERSIDMIIGMLGILKADGAYLPIDPQYPQERISYMLQDSKAQVLLTQVSLIGSVSFEHKVIALDDFDSDKINEAKYNIDEKGKTIEDANQPCKQLAYIIYTSGSTGKPKGVMIEHWSVINLIYSQMRQFDINEQERILQFSSMCFDASVEQIFTALLSGAALILVDKDRILNLSDFEDYLIEHKVTHMHTVPLFLNGVSWRDEYSLKRVIAGGDVCPIGLAEKWSGKCQFYNEYGPTETTVTSIELLYDNSAKQISIGKPISNTRVYILDKYNNIQPVGIQGEMYIGGDGLARGYLNRPELTKERFVENPFMPGELMYRTGDLARWLPDGNLEFLGRADQQVKIRGYRIELGEIESKLLAHKYIKESTVVVKEEHDSSKYLCAYFTAEQEITPAEIREHLSAELPDYMIPSYFVQLVGMPLTPSGKLDKNALPEPDKNAASSSLYEAPRNQLEEKLEEIWKSVLNVSKLSINDSFFELGGHSLTATAMMAQIRKELKAEISLKDIFKKPTIKGISEYISSKEASLYSEPKQIEKREYYEASSAQKRIYMLQQLGEDSISYNMPGIIEVHGDVCQDRLRNAFREVIQRHDSLRTSFLEIEGELMQKVYDEIEFDLLNLNTYAALDKAEAVQAIMQAFVKPFDLSNAPLLRAGICELPKDEASAYETITEDRTYIVIFDMHHIISDGVSMNILINDLLNAYQGIQLQELKLQYKDYAHWQNVQKQTKKMQQQEEYWLQQFTEEIPVLNLPTDYQRPSVKSFEGDRLRFRIGKELTDKIGAAARAVEATLYMVLLGSINILLSKYSGQEDIVIGSPIAGRTYSEFDSIIGMFVNTLAMRNYPKGEKTVREFLKEVKVSSLRAYENQDYQFDELVQKLNAAGDMSRNPLFDVMFALQNAGGKEISLQELKFKSYEADSKTSKFDLTIIASELEGQLNIEIEYSTKLFKRETIERLKGHFCRVLEEITEDIDKSIKNIQILTSSEKHQLLNSFNNTMRKYPREKTVQEVFEEQVQKSPDSTALIYEDKHLTYRELNEKANQLARILRNNGIGSDSIVGLMVEASLETVIGIMGIIKAGGAYMPIDLEHPIERIKYMLEDSCSKVLLTKSNIADKQSFSEYKLIFMDDESIYRGQSHNLEHCNSSDNLVYIIYTSGSTGLPKGNLTTHCNIINLIKYTDFIDIDSTDRILQLSNYAFDASSFNIFSALLNGAGLVMIKKEDILDMDKLSSIIKGEGITITLAPTAIFNMMTDSIGESLSGIKKLIFGGEKASLTHVKKALEYLGRNKIIHAYGPTESTVYSTCYVVNEIDEELRAIPIGGPIANTRVYVLDKHNNLCPIGVAGELCISGDGLVKGYLNRQDLTRDKFVYNPYEQLIDGEKARMYRTGDLVRWLPDGNIEFLDRIDHQVKIRGYRIELGEIESRLLLHKEIKEAVVNVAEADGSKYICAYVVAHNDKADDTALTLGAIKEFLSKDLPEYMLPAYLIKLDKLPLTSNGKVNRKALPLPNMEAVFHTEYEAPGSETEHKLAEIWQELLGLSTVGINNSFFELGGHSLKAAKLTANIHKELNVQLQLKDIFTKPTIKELSRHIEALSRSSYSQIQPIEDAEILSKGIYELSSAQKRIFTLQQFDSNNVSYNMPMALEIQGQLNKQRLAEAFKELINRHEALRTSFEYEGDRLVQKVHKDAAFEVEFTNLEYSKDYLSELKKIAADFVKPFDLSKAPLLRARLITLLEASEDTDNPKQQHCFEGMQNHKILPEQQHMLLLDVHHIVSDGTSMSILIDEFIRLYRGDTLPKLRIHYKDYTLWQSEAVEKGIFREQEEYWINRFSGELPVLNLPTDYPRPSIRSFEGDYISFKLGADLAQKIKELQRKTGATLYMLLLAAYNIVLSKYTGQEDIVIGSPIAGRPHSDLHSMIGMFINTLAMRNYPEAQKTFWEFLSEVKSNSLRAYENQGCQFEELVEKLNVVRDMSRNPVFDVMLTVQNIDMGEVKLEGLTIKPFELESKISKFDLNFTATESENDVFFTMEYCTSLFKGTTIQALISHFINILDKISDNLDIKLCDIDMLSMEERRQLYDFNAVKRDYSLDMGVHNIFEQLVYKYPDNTAVVFENKSITYKQLNSKANQLARLLKQKGVGADDIAALVVERSIEMIIGIMAVLKAGAAYLPINPDYPIDRISYMLEDSGAKLVLTQERYMNMLKDHEAVINLEADSLYSGEEANLETEHIAAAYVIYTSGSTGKPKGVVIEHRSLINFVHTLNEKFDNQVLNTDRCLSLTNISFDVSVGEIFFPLLNGAALVLFNNDRVLDIRKLAAVIAEEEINFAYIPPTVLTEVYSILKDYGRKLAFNKLLVGVEPIKDYVLEKYFELNDNMQIVNGYGPTEATICAAMYKLEKTASSGRIVPIGKPMNNTGIYMLDKSSRLVPVGVAGELYVTGVGLARGYLNRAELTAEKFVYYPHITEERMYRTGDLARWLPDGNIEFMGRLDHQVKVRGYRIELGEIENQLLSYTLVKQAVALARQDSGGNKYICAYLIGEDKINIKELREHLSKELPDYMIPSYFLQLEEIPLTENGKVNRKALPEPNLHKELAATYEAPRNAVEDKLQKLWQEILNVEGIGINENFFELGGHSLKATILAAKIHRELNIELPLKEIFKTPTIKGLAEYISVSEETIYSSIEAVQPRKYDGTAAYYAASSAQKRIYALQQFDTHSISYNMPIIMEVEGELELDRLEAAFRSLIQRHDVFRTGFELENEELVQKIYNTADFKVEYKENESPADQNTIIKSFIRPFDLTAPPLLRVCLIKLTADSENQQHCSRDVQNVNVLPNNQHCLEGQQHMLLLDVHHIISDGASMSILIEEFMMLYMGKELPKLRLQYKDYAEWQNSLDKGEKHQKQKTYWLGVFEDEIPVLNMPSDYPRPTLQSFEGQSLEFTFEDELTKALKDLAKRTGSTMYMIILSLFNVLLSKYSGQEDIVIGTPSAGRPHADLQSIVGMFVNTLAIRNYPSGQKAFIEFLKDTKDIALKAFENQDYQFEDLVQELKVVRDTSRNPLFDVMFSMQSMESKEFNIQGLSFKTCEAESKAAKFDLSLEAREEDSRLCFSMQYSCKLYSRETIEGLCIHLKKIAHTIAADCGIKLKDIDITTDEEKQVLLKTFNASKLDYPRHKTLNELFEEQAELTPQNIALIYKEHRLTYKELNQKANQVARILRSKGVMPDQPVGIMAERSLEMIIGIMGILKAGAAYLPIDPEYPKDRIDFMLIDSGIKVLLTKCSYSHGLNYHGEILSLDNEGTYCADISNPDIINKAEDLSYVIYTSGSTGTPKGVLVEHRNAVNLIYSQIKSYGITEDERVLQFSSICFDASIEQIFITLLSGAALVILDKEHLLNMDKLEEAVKEHKITHINAVPAYLSNILWNNSYSIKRIVSGGDTCPPSLAERWYRHCDFYNVYGPTEATITSTSCLIRSINQKMLIGKPVANTRIYIVDQYNKLQPVGIPGELCIAGAGIARGYLNRDELTEERFIPDIFVSAEYEGKRHERMYRTGDLARWLPDGNIEFLGRIDHQVKIRGYRIELGEIESRLQEHKSIEAALVTVVDTQEDKQLCAYYVCQEDIELSELKAYMSKELPEYMIPAYFIKLNKLPMTANGKIDRKLLPQPDISLSKQSAYEAPRDLAEEKLLKLWQEILKLDAIGINDNFFELGGHSLKAASLSAKIHKELNAEVPLKEIFKSPTIKGLAEYIRESAQSMYSAIEIAEPQKYYPLSSAQKRIYTLQQYNTQSISYNIPSVYIVEGSIDKERIETAFKALIERHEALRTCFVREEEEAVQIINDSADFKLEELILADGDIESAVRSFIRPFDLTKAPLLRAGLIKLINDPEEQQHCSEDMENRKILPKQQHMLLLDVHHIISDGFSINILINEFTKLYEGHKLPELRLQYKDYAVWQNTLYLSEGMQDKEDYWLRTLENAPVLKLPTDYERPRIQGFEGDVIFGELEAELAEALREICNKTGATMFMLLLTAFSVLLSKYSGQEDIVIGSPAAGRPHADLQSIIGMFVNTIALRSCPSSSKTFRQLLEETKQTAIKAFEYQDYQFEELIERLGITRDLSRNPIFDVMFTLQNSDNSNINFSELNFRPYELKTNISKFDITVTAIDSQQSIIFGLEYRVSLFKKETMEVLLSHYMDILRLAVQNPDIELSAIELEYDIAYAEDTVQYDDTDFNF